MKKLLFIILITFISLVSSQTFTEIETPIPNIGFGDAQWGDYDGDGDLDIMIMGVYPTVELNRYAIATLTIHPNIKYS